MDLDLVLQSDAQDGFRELPDMLPYIRLSRELTPAALKKFQKKNGLNRQLGYREGLSGDASHLVLRPQLPPVQMAGHTKGPSLPHGEGAAG